MDEVIAKEGSDHMRRYIDGFVIPVPKRKVKEYRKMAAEAGRIWMKHGALQYIECVGEDLKMPLKWGGLPFTKMARAKPSETVVFSFIVYKSRAHRDRVNARVMGDPEISANMEKGAPMPFDMKRMAVGGFETLVMY